MKPQINPNSSKHALDNTEWMVIPKTKSKDYDLFLRMFYQHCQEDRNLFTLNERKLDVTKLTMDHILKFQHSIESKVTEGIIKKNTETLLFSYLDQLCQSLTRQGLVKLYYRPPLRAEKAASPRRINPPFPIVNEFERYMESRNYSPKSIKDYKTSVSYFLRQVSYRPPNEENGNAYWYEKMTNFEEKLRSRIILEEIKVCTAYNYLNAINVFLAFLRSQKKLKFLYEIPEDLIGNGERTNEYVNMQDLKLFLETIFNTSKHLLRDICMVLILFETGCRPIEVINLRMEDVSIHEKRIILTSKKSSQRTLFLSGFSMDLIKEYLQIRNNYIKKSDVQALFLSSSGMPLHRGYISHLFRTYNLRAFNKIHFTAKTLRHTFITDALDSNSPEQVKETVGHKHLISTYYYTYRGDKKYKSVFEKYNIYGGTI